MADLASQGVASNRATNRFIDNQPTLRKVVICYRGEVKISNIVISSNAGSTLCCSSEISAYIQTCVFRQHDGFRSALALTQKDGCGPWHDGLKELHVLHELPCVRGSHASWRGDAYLAGRCALS